MLFGFLIILVALLILGYILFKRISPKDETSIYLKIAIAGAVGWLVAYFVHLILVQISQILTISALGGNISNQSSIASFATNYAVLIWGPIFAAIIEETGRYFIFKYYPPSHRDRFQAPVIFGLGWGLGAAIVAYLPDIFIANSNNTIGEYLSSFLGKATAIGFDILMSLVVINSLYEGKFFQKTSLFLAMIFHFGFDFTSVIWQGSLSNLKNTYLGRWTWSLEIVIFILTILFGIFILKYWLPKKAKMIKEGKMDLNAVESAIS